LGVPHRACPWSQDHGVVLTEDLALVVRCSGRSHYGGPNCAGEYRQPDQALRMEPSTRAKG
jgi:hypothetical protein